MDRHGFAGFDLDMSGTEPYPPGTPCWADIAVPDIGAAVTFYERVVGWNVTTPDPQFGGYAIAQFSGNDVAGIGPLPVPGMPTTWTHYFATDDARATTLAIHEHGGSVLLDVGDIGRLGRLCIAADPTGGVFGVWEAGTYRGATIGEPGCMTWLDLRSADPDTARDFYSGVFGFSHGPVPGAPDGYETFSLPGGNPLGGIGGIVDEEGLHPHWAVYFSVTNASAAVDAAVAEGGLVLVEDFDTEFGQLAGLADPFGATFWVVQLPPEHR